MNKKDTNKMGPRTNGKSPLVVSVVFPVFNEIGNLRTLHNQVREAFSEGGVNYEMVFVDNGSSDGSLDVIKELAESDSCVRYISLSRNFGHQGGLFAGMNYCDGDAVITMDADLQHPPSIIPAMLTLWKQGHDVVYTTKKNNRAKGFKGFQVKLFYKLLSRISGLNLSFGQSDFRLIDRKVANALLALTEQRKFLRGLVHWTGFNQVGLEYEVSERLSGQSKFSYLSLVSLAVDGILSFSVLPLRWMLAVGVATASAAFLYAAVSITLGALSFFDVDVGVGIPPGWATLVGAITFLGGIQLIAIGVLGEYIGRIYEQGKGRPSFIVNESSHAANLDPSAVAGQVPQVPLSKP